MGEYLDLIEFIKFGKAYVLSTYFNEKCENAYMSSSEVAILNKLKIY